MISPAYNVKLSAYDSDGLPIVGAKLYTYLTGTTTPKITWTDSTKVTPNTNPIILDSSGQADVWIDGSYRFKLVGADDVTLWTKDGIVSWFSATAMLDSFNALTLIADRLPYGSGTDEFSMAIFTAFARTLLDDGDAQTVRNTLNVFNRTMSEITATATDMGTDLYTASFSPTLAAYVSGGYYFITFTDTNTTTAPTINIDGLGAKTIKLLGGGALFAGSLTAGHHAILKYDGTNMILLNPIEYMTPDESTVERNGWQIRVKDLGIVESKIGALAVTAGKIGALAVETAKINNAAVTQGKLATSIGSVDTIQFPAELILPGGEYGFYPQIKNSSAGKFLMASISNGVISSSYISNIYLVPENTSGSRGYAQQRYVTASGEIFWLFLLRDKQTGGIIAGYQSPDHPCFGNGGKPNLVQHPFANVRYNKWLGNKEVEIIICNPSHELIQEAMFKKIAIEGGYPDKTMFEDCKKLRQSNDWQGLLRVSQAKQKFKIKSDTDAKAFLLDYQGLILDEDRPNRDLLEVLTNDYKLNCLEVWGEKICTVGLPDEDLHGTSIIDWRMMPIGTPIEPIQVEIPQPQDTLAYSIKLNK